MRYKAIPGGWRRTTAYLLMVVLCIGCAGTPSQHRPDSPASAPAVVPLAAVRPPQGQLAAASIEARLRAEVRQWRGTPHKMGGSSKGGVDCSGFVQRLYRDLFDRTIPRSTALQVQSGRSVKRSRLSPGDLIFFKPPYKVRHVGIYLGNDEFAHASTSKGVMVSHLSETYWRECYWTARRYLSN